MNRPSKEMIICPFCGHSAKEFLSYGVHSPVFSEFEIIGGGFRKNALCPSCGSLDRERLLFLFLHRRTEVFARPLRILHVAPEPILGKRLKQSSPDYLSVDLNSPYVMQQIDIRAIPFANSSFDLVICNHVLEHIEEDRIAIAELYRVTAEGGMAILQVPIALRLSKTLEGLSLQSDAERTQIYGQMDHVRIYGLDYDKRLEETGFQLMLYDPETDTEADLRVRYALIPKECLRVAVRVGQKNESI